MEVGEGRTRFFAFAGLFSSLVFALVIFCDTIGVLLVPACAKHCPTESIQFGPVEELRERAKKRVADLHSRSPRVNLRTQRIGADVRATHP